MPKHIILHDQRLFGGTPLLRQSVSFPLGGATPVAAALNFVGSQARVDELLSLSILCHGYAGIDTQARVCGDFGGMGLQLGREGVMHSNVGLWQAIRGMVPRIVVYACGAADTQSHNRGTAADGRYLMGALALATRAEVFAADRIQWYSTRGGRIDFGRWEGQLLRFDPRGGSSAVLGNQVPGLYSAA
jgi:hypothetical protein